MDINITLIERYFESIKFPITTYVATDSPGVIVFQAGRPEENSSRRVLVDASDLIEILKINNIIGTGSSVQKILDTKNERKAEEKIEDLIYRLLVDYIYQLFTSSRGVVHNKKIIPLAKHNRDFTES